MIQSNDIFLGKVNNIFPYIICTLKKKKRMKQIDYDDASRSRSRISRAFFERNFFFFFNILKHGDYFDGSFVTEK